jgi:uncharacterized protein (UPF0335 family)
MTEIIEAKKLKQIIDKLETIEQERLEIFSKMFLMMLNQ